MNVEQLQSFRRDGYLVVPDFVSPEELALLRTETRGLHEALASQVPPGVGVSWEPGVSPPRIQQVMNAERISPALDRVLSSKRMLSFVQSELGPDVSLFHAKLIMKASDRGGDIPWHQDFSSWDRETPSPMHLNCMLYIDDADEQNGCLQVIPGSHRAGVRPHAEAEDHAAFTLSLETDTSRAVSLPGRAGSAIFFGPLLVHGSGANRSQRDRRSATVVFMMGARQGQRLLARGEAPENVSAFFPEATVSRMSGSGPHAGGCASRYRKLELWNLARAMVGSETAPWLELTTRSVPEDSFEWMAARKPHDVPYFRFEVFPASTSNRDDVHVLAGEFEASFGQPCFARVNEGLGLVLVDCWVYWTARSAFTRLLPHLRVGTVLVIDRFYGYEGWERESARALYEVAQDARLSLLYLCRADTQVAIQVVGIGDGPRVSSAQVDWTPTLNQITVERPPFPADRPEPAVPQATDVRFVARKLSGLNRHISRLGAQAARSLPSEAGVHRLFPRIEIPRFVGEGPIDGGCAPHARRRELWQYAVSLVEDNTAPWCEFGVGSGESFDWFAARKPRQNVLMGFDTFEGIPEPWHGFSAGQWKSPVYQPNRSDVVIVRGRFEQTLQHPDVQRRLQRGVGLLHVDCDLYSSTRAILSGLRHHIRRGTVIVFDEFYGYEDWFRHEAKAFHEFVHEAGLSFEYLARTDWQVAMRVLAIGTGAAWRCRVPEWRGSTPGIRLEYEPRPERAERRLAKRVLRVARERLHVPI